MMSDFDYALDVDTENNDDFEERQFAWDNSEPAPGPIFNSRPSNSGFMNAQYSEAFGDYRGGYGPGGGFGTQRPSPYPPGPPPQGRGYGPMGPPRRGPLIHKAAHFLADCEVFPQYIKAMPWRVLDMIAPDYCGLCSQNLESFAAAKIHYNCINHYRKQKKFMALNKPIKNKSEIPLKARNLYCELCDVQITSQSHADSHYAGKSHRAIIEGRKDPKNPALNQHGMADRINQLIRREKKHLKAVPEVVKVDESVIVDKNIPPELVCEICKTSVTCSEQMTNHMNGKKHLAREKNHILQMMKGASKKNNTDKIKEENEADVNGGEEAGGGPQTGGEQETVVTVDDWTAGGGAEWDSHNTVEPKV